jgi:hypothetical protein
MEIKQSREEHVNVGIVMLVQKWPVAPRMKYLKNFIIVA